MDDDHEPLLAFLIPVLADSSLVSLQAFFRKKDLLNSVGWFHILH